MKNKPNPTKLSGIIFDIPDPEYRAAEGVSNSALKKMRPTPYHYKYALDNPEKPTHPMEVGQVFHKAIFEPDKFGLEKSHVIRPEEWNDYRTNAAKAWRAEQRLPILTAAEHASNEAMANAIRKNPCAKEWLTNVRAEVGFFVKDKETGLMRKGKLDGLASIEPIILDIKTIENDAATFEKQSGDLFYFQQDAYYRDLAEDNEVEIARFIFIVVEKNRPHGVRICEHSADDVALGRAIYRNDLRRLAHCLEKNEWPSYPTKPEEISLTRFARDRAELQAMAV